MPHLTPPRTRLDRGPVAFYAGPVLLVWLMCTAVQAATLPPGLRDLALSFFPDADRVAELDGSPPAAPVFRGQELLGYVFLSDQVVRIPAYSGKPISVLVGSTWPHPSEVCASSPIRNRSSWSASPSRTSPPM